MTTLSHKILSIVSDSTLTHEQKVHILAKTAENCAEALTLTPSILELLDTGVICDLGEGNAPYAPRYIIPDYSLLMSKGCKFLNLPAPTNLFEAINTLLIFYKHVPSVTHFPVYIGNLDTLLEPFIKDEQEAYTLIEGFLLHIDRTISDSFCHANIGPLETRAGKIILEVSRKLQTSTPNLTLKYDQDLTSDALMYSAVQTALSCAKPSFANHQMYTKDWGEDYAIASCYNGLKIGGGAFTLVRLILKEVANRATSTQNFFDQELPHCIEQMCLLMDKRIEFLVESSHFFSSNFLALEGFIDQAHFSGMFGLVGLAECVNILLEKEGQQDRFGQSEKADRLGLQIMSAIQTLVNGHHNPYCICSDYHFLLHGQVGLASDQNISPATRIPIGEEPDLYAHLRQAATFHSFFPAGTGDIFPFDLTAAHNPDSIMDIIKGAMNLGLRYFSTYSKDSDVIRITGYLVKKSDIEKLQKGQAVQQDTVVLGLGATENCKILERKVR